MNKVTAKSRHFLAFSTIRAKRTALKILIERGKKNYERVTNRDSNTVLVVVAFYLCFLPITDNTYPTIKDKRIVPLSTHPDLFHKFK
jgi:hypothetical protein